MASAIDLILPIKAVQFDLNYNQDITPSGRGFIQTIERSDPFWIAEYTTPPLTGDRLGIVEHLLLQTEGAKNPFFAYDSSKLCPRAYKMQAALAEPWGSATVTAGSRLTASLDLTFGASITLLPGDMIAFDLDGAARLFKCSESRVGTSFTMNVKPRPPYDFSGSIEVRLIRAGCDMKIIGRPEWNKSVDTPPSVSFRAVQYIPPPELAP